MVSWTDSRSDLLGSLRGVGPDIGELHARWQDEAKLLGRIEEHQPLVRAPGPPNDVICTSLDEPLVDPHGRRWRIERVRFLDRQDYERVVFVLERTGDVRAGQTASVTVDPMPVEAIDVRISWGTATEPRSHRARGANAGSDPGARPGSVPARGDGPGQGALHRSRRSGHARRSSRCTATAATRCVSRSSVHRSPATRIGPKIFIDVPRSEAP